MNKGCRVYRQELKLYILMRVNQKTQVKLIFMLIQRYIISNISLLVIAVSVGASILFYRNLKPYFKYTLPSLDVHPAEKEVWTKVRD